MTKRRRISTRTRAALFERDKGLCHMCGLRVDAGQAWDVSHEIPLAIGGADDETNWKVAHRRCHRTHTAEVDQPKIAKARHQRDSHNGSKSPTSSPLQGRGFVKIEREPKRLSAEKRCAGSPALMRRFGLMEDAS